jgi:hypothetical protein
MAAEVSSIARMLRGEAVKKGGVAPKKEMVTMDLLGGCGGDSAGGSSGEDEVVDLDVKVPVGWERRLDLSVSSSFLCLFCSVLLLCSYDLMGVCSYTNTLQLHVWCLFNSRSCGSISS